MSGAPMRGGARNARVTFVEPLNRYIIPYTAYSPMGRGSHWLNRRSRPLAADGARHLCSVARRRTGRLGRQGPSFFPVAIQNPSGIRSWPCLHRPALFRHSARRKLPATTLPRVVDLDRESIWISYCPPTLEGPNPDRLGRYHLFITGLGTPFPLGAAQNRSGNSSCPYRPWVLILYHGVSDLAKP